jgi:hypothetical protein
MELAIGKETRMRSRFYLPSSGPSLKLVGLTLVMAALAVTVSRPVDAATLPAYEPWTACSYWPADGNRIIVHPPLMKALGNYAIVNGNIILNVPQTVGYRVSVYRLNKVGTPVYYSGSPLLTRTVTDSDGASTDGWWWNTATKRWDYPINYWIYDSGRYMVWVEYYWFANQYFGSASTAGWVRNLEGSDDPICDY